jgi:hypothetical protein
VIEVLHVLLSSVFPRSISRYYASPSEVRNTEFLRVLAEIKAEERVRKSASPAPISLVERLRQTFSKAA